MVQLVYLSKDQNALLTGLAAGLAHQMESGSRKFIRSIPMKEGSITFQRLTDGTIRALILAKGVGSGYSCMIGSFLSSLSVRYGRIIGDRMFTKIGSVAGFNVYEQENSAPDTTNLTPWITAVSASTHTASCIYSQRFQRADIGERHEVLFIVDGAVKFIQPSNFFPYQSIVPVHVPTFGLYPAAVYQASVAPPNKVRTFIQYLVRTEDKEEENPAVFKLCNLELQRGFRERYNYDPTLLDPDYNTDLIQLQGGLSVVVAPNNAIFAVYFKKVFTGEQPINSDAGRDIKAPDFVSAELYIAGVDKKQSFDEFTGMKYGLDLRTFLEPANFLNVACLVVASTSEALFYFFHWVYTNSSWTKPLAHSREHKSTLYFTTVNPDKTLTTKTLWEVNDSTPTFSHESLSSWHLSGARKSYAPAFMIQPTRRLSPADSMGDAVAAIEVQGVITITSNVDVPYSVGFGNYPDGAFTYDIKTGVAAVVGGSYKIPGIDSEVIDPTQRELIRLLSPAVGVFGEGQVDTIDFSDGRTQHVQFSTELDTNNKKIVKKDALDVVFEMVDTSISKGNPPVPYHYMVGGVMLVKETPSQIDYIPPCDGGGVIPPIALT